MAAIWTDLFESMIAPGDDLRWARKGPGIGRDARIAYSGLLGRYMARAYLTEREGVRVLVPLDVAKNWLKESPYSIEKDPPGRGLEADWIGLDRHGLLIVEAKGTYDIRKDAWQGPSSLPPSLETAIGQAERTAVFMQRSGIRGKLPVKRWAIASRWGTEAKPRRCPTLLAWDTGENCLKGKEYRDLEHLLLRADAEGVIEGLDHDRAAATQSPPAKSRSGELHLGIRVGHLRVEPGFAAVLGPFGVRALRKEGDILLLRQALMHETGIVIASLSERYLSTVIVGERRTEAGPNRVDDEIDTSRVTTMEDHGDVLCAVRGGLTVAWPKGRETPIEAQWD